MNCAIFANVTRAALIGDRFWCKEACHASFLDAFQCTVSLESPEKVLRAAHMTFVHAISGPFPFVLLEISRVLCAVSPQSIQSSQSRPRGWCQRGTHVVTMVTRGPPPVSHDSDPNKANRTSL
jgi:hypothetical protein